MGIKREPKPAEWTDNDADRLKALKIIVWQYAKPTEIVKLYGLVQRLTAKALRIRGGPYESQSTEEFASKIPDLTAHDCQFLIEMIRSVLDGESNAFAALKLNFSPNNEPAEKLMAAQYMLYCKAAGGKKTPLRDEIAERWHVTGPRVSQVSTKHAREINKWIGDVIALTKQHHIPEQLVIWWLLDEVTGAFERNTSGDSKKTTNRRRKIRPENFFLVDFPVPVKST